MISHLLTEEQLDLDCLLMKLRSHVDAKLWYQFGMAIGIPTDVLETFKGYDQEECMIELADYWLRNHPAKPTWSEICNAAKKFASQNLVQPYGVIQDIMPGKNNHCLAFKYQSCESILIPRINKATTKCLPRRSNTELYSSNSKIHQISSAKIRVSPSNSSKNRSAKLMTILMLPQSF